MKLRTGSSLIELVFAIVIIGISVMSIPMMLSQSTNNDSLSIVQESILASRTKMGTILSHVWDKNSLASTATSTTVRVLDVKNGDVELNRDISSLNSYCRIGHVQKSLRRRLHEGNATNKTFPDTGTLEVNKTSINSFDTEFLGSTLLDGNRSQFDYAIRDFNMSTNVYYLSDDTDYNKTVISFDFNASNKFPLTNVNNSTNIKMIEIGVEIKSGIPFKIRAFSSNIGQNELLKLNTGDL